MFWLCKNTQRWAAVVSKGKWRKGRLPSLSVSPSCHVFFFPACICQNHWLRLGKMLSTLYPMNKKFWMYIELCSHVWFWMVVCVHWLSRLSYSKIISLFPPGGQLKVPHLEGVDLKIKKEKHPLEMENIKIHCHCGYQKHRVYIQWKCSHCYPAVREEAYTNSKLKYGH